MGKPIEGVSEVGAIGILFEAGYNTSTQDVSTSDSVGIG